jgi:hypothetical protein
VAGEHWKDKPEAEDFPVAESYLSLLVGADAAAKLAKALRKERSLKHYAAKDLAGRRLGDARPGRLRGRRRPQEGQARRQAVPCAASSRVPLWVADGYHRICASYYLDEKIEVPCRIVDRKHLVSGNC